MGPIRRVRAPGRALAGLLALVASLAVLAGASSVAAAPAAPERDTDLQVSVAINQAPPGGGIATSDEMAYTITVANAGPASLADGSLLLVLYVNNAEGGRTAMEVANFNGNGTRPAPGGFCGTGLRTIVQCTNQGGLDVGGQLTVQIRHRHPQAVAGAMAFVAEVSVVTDPNVGNNTFRSPAYSFANPPTTSTSTTTITTTSSTTTTSTSSTTSSSSTTTSSSTTSTTASTTTSTTSTTASSSTSTTLLATASSTTTTAPPTSSSTLSLLTGSGSLPSTTVQVQGDSGVSDDGAQAAAPNTQSGSGPPLMLIGAILAALIVLGGIGVAIYAHLNRAPPMVDIRQFDNSQRNQYYDGHF